MDPVTLSIIAALGSSLISGIQSGRKQAQYNKYADEASEALRENLAAQLTLLQQQLTQATGAEQFASAERRYQLLRELGLVNVSAAAANVKGNSLLRQEAVAKIDAAKDIAVRQQNIRDILRQGTAQAKGLQAQTKTQINQLKSGKANPVATGFFSGVGTGLRFLPTIQSFNS